jgi:hypothetical protein
VLPRPRRLTLANWTRLSARAGLPVTGGVAAPPSSGMNSRRLIRLRIASLQSWSAAAGCCRAHERQAAVEAEMDPTLLAE